MKVNGEVKELLEPISLSAFLEQEDYAQGRVAVERNMEIVPKAAYEQTILSNDDVLEIVHFVGGG